MEFDYMMGISGFVAPYCMTYIWMTYTRNLWIRKYSILKREIVSEEKKKKIEEKGGKGEISDDTIRKRKGLTKS